MSCVLYNNVCQLIDPMTEVLGALYLLRLFNDVCLYWLHRHNTTSHILVDGVVFVEILESLLQS